MKLRKTDQVVMIAISAIVFICISILYMSQYRSAHDRLNCQYYALGIHDTLRACRQKGCSDAEAQFAQFDPENSFGNKAVDLYQTDEGSVDQLQRFYKSAFTRCDNVD